MGIYAIKKYSLSVSFDANAKIPATRVTAHPFNINELLAIRLIMP